MGKRIQALFENDKMIGADVAATGGDVTLFIGTLMASVPSGARKRILDNLNKIQDIEDSEEYLYEFCKNKNSKPNDLLRELANKLNELIEEVEGKDNE